MKITSIITILILSIGAIQGIVYGIILFKSTKYNKIANKILAAILFLLSYRLIIQIMRLFGLGYYDSWYYIMIDLSWIHGALIYYYTKAQTQPNLNFNFKRKDFIHLLPLIFQIAISVFVRVQNLYWDGTKESLSWLGYYSYIIWMNNSTIYIIASFLITLYSYKSLKLLNSIDNRYEISKEKLTWIKRILVAFLIYFTLVLVVFLFDLIIFKSSNVGSYFYFTRFYYYPFFIGIAIITYWIGIEGFSRRNEPELMLKNTINKDEMLRLKVISEKLIDIMEIKELYKNQELSLEILSKEINVKPYLISKCLSEIFNKRFNDFVNQYRVKQVQLLLKDQENSKYTLLSLALDAGFNSKSSFNRAIKKHLGISPSELKFTK